MSEWLSDDVRIHLNGGARTITVTTHPYCTRFGLVAEILQRTSTEACVNITLPTQNTDVLDLLTLYAKHNILPYRIESSDIFDEFELAMRYLMCEDMRQVTLDSVALNKLLPNDVAINNSRDVFPLYDNEYIDPMRVNIGTENLSYATLVNPKYRVSVPYNLPDALHRSSTCKTHTCFREVFMFGLYREEILGDIPQTSCILSGHTFQSLYSKSTAGCNASDICVYFTNVDADQLREIIARIGVFYEEVFGQYIMLETAYELTLFRAVETHRNTVRISRYTYTDLADVFDSFDHDAHCIAYNSESILCNRRGIRALLTGYNIIDTRRVYPNFEERLVRCTVICGLGIAVPGLDHRRLSMGVGHSDCTCEHGSPSCMRSRGIGRMLDLLYSEDSVTVYDLAESTSWYSLLRTLKKLHSIRGRDVPVFRIRYNDTVLGLPQPGGRPQRVARTCLFHRIYGYRTRCTDGGRVQAPPRTYVYDTGAFQITDATVVGDIMHAIT